MAEALDPPFDRPDRGFNDLPGWTWVGTYGGYYLQADRLAEFDHGFFTRQWQGRGPEELACALSAGITVHRPRQIHSADVLPASEARGEPWPEADGLVSDGAGQSLWVCGADCTPVLIADPATGRVGACQAPKGRRPLGRRGLEWLTPVWSVAKEPGSVKERHVESVSGQGVVSEDRYTWAMLIRPLAIALLAASSLVATKGT